MTIPSNFNEYVAQDKGLAIASMLNGITLLLITVICRMFTDDYLLLVMALCGLFFVIVGAITANRALKKEKEVRR